MGQYSKCPLFIELKFKIPPFLMGQYVFCKQNTSFRTLYLAYPKLVLANTRLLDTLEASDALVDSETQVLLQPRRGTRDKLNKTKTSSALFIR